MGDVNIRPDMYTKGGGLFDDFDGTITDIRFIMTDYNGTSPNMVPAACVVFNVDGEEFDDLLSVGGKDDYIPDETGRGLNKVKSRDSLTETNNFARFSDSLVKVGFPINRMDPKDVGPIIGTKGHFLRVLVEHKGLKKRTENERDKMVMTCTKILRLPWEEEKGKSKGKAKGKVANEELAEKMTSVIQGIILNADGSIAKKDMLSALFKDETVKALDDKKGAFKLAQDDTFLKGREEWTYEDGVLKFE